MQAAKAAAELQEDATLQLASDMDRDLHMLESRPSAAGTSAEGRSTDQDDMEITEQELLVGTLRQMVWLAHSSCLQYFSGACRTLGEAT